MKVQSPESKAQRLTLHRMGREARVRQLRIAAVLCRFFSALDTPPSTPHTRRSPA